MNTYVPPEGIEGFHDEILQGGEALVALSSFEYPDADAVSDVISRVHEIVAEWGLMGMWVPPKLRGGIMLRLRICKWYVPYSFLSLFVMRNP